MPKFIADTRLLKTILWPQITLAHSIMLPVAMLVGMAFIMVLILLHMDAMFLGSILQDHQRWTRDKRTRQVHTFHIFTCMLAKEQSVITETINCRCKAWTQSVTPLQQFAYEQTPWHRSTLLAQAWRARNTLHLSHTENLLRFSTFQHTTTEKDSPPKTCPQACEHRWHWWWSGCPGTPQSGWCLWSAHPPWTCSCPPWSLPSAALSPCTAATSTCQMVDMQAIAYLMTRCQVLIMDPVSGHKVANSLNVYCWVARTAVPWPTGCEQVTMCCSHPDICCTAIQGAQQWILRPLSTQWPDAISWSLRPALQTPSVLSCHGTSCASIQKHRRENQESWLCPWTLLLDLLVQRQRQDCWLSRLTAMWWDAACFKPWFRHN